jgi:hypothetical protein
MEDDCIESQGPQRAVALGNNNNNNNNIEE